MACDRRNNGANLTELDKARIERIAQQMLWAVKCWCLNNDQPVPIEPNDHQKESLLQELRVHLTKNL